MTSMDLAYSHVFFADGAIDRASAIPGLGQARLVAEAKQDIDILGLSIKVKLGRAGSPLRLPSGSSADAKTPKRDAGLLGKSSLFVHYE